jgi:hypothetical protein
MRLAVEERRFESFPRDFGIILEERFRRISRQQAPIDRADGEAGALDDRRPFGAR